MAARLILAVLITLNFLFAIYANNIAVERVPDERMDRQIAVEKIRIVAKGDHPPPVTAEAKTPPVVVPSGTSSPVATAAQPPPDQPKVECTMWNGLSRETADRLADLARTQFADLKIERKEERETKSYWVFIPDIPSRADAERRVSDLKKLGVPEYFIVQSGGASRVAISLGIFSSEAAANDRLNELQGKGVKNAKTGPRDSRAYFNISAYGTVGQINTWNEATQAQVSNGKPIKCSVPVKHLVR